MQFYERSQITIPQSSYKVKTPSRIARKAYIILSARQGALGRAYRERATQGLARYPRVEHCVQPISQQVPANAEEDQCQGSWHKHPPIGQRIPA
jgi:hypothetical protein